jgi:hypothetical protein
LKSASAISEYDFDNPAELLGKIEYHRAWLEKLGESTLDLEVVARKSKEIEELKLKLKPIDERIDELRRYLDRGFLDRTAYRSLLNEIHPEKASIEYEIGKLRAAISDEETKERRRVTYSKPARDFLENINRYVVTYSHVSISLRNENHEYLLVPDAVRQKTFSLEIPLLATNSDLGKALLGQEIGKIQSTDPRFSTLELCSLQIAEDDYLQYLSGIYSASKQARAIRVRDRHLGSSVQRWRDGARSDAYILCKRCDSLYPFGSTCEC